MKHFDVIVVGGGHAGAEAAWFAEKLGCSVALITMDASKIGDMSCNPAIGGIGKGHIVREIDALGGLMALAADATGIQFRLLNRKKGPAVQGPRAQSDREKYKDFIQKALYNLPNLTILEAEVAALKLVGRTVRGVELSDSSVIQAKSVILATGTFLNGRIHMGLKNKEGGRIGDRPSQRLADCLYDMALGVSRLKTGTPPRLSSKSINWRSLDRQPGDSQPQLFSFLSESPILRQVECGLTETNPYTHELLAKNIDKTALFGGAISGKGPRYCPSIEDKISRFPEKDSHQVFLEPEGLDSDWVYPNGISTSLDPHLQLELVRTIVGLEAAEIVQPGYAIEYDFLDPRGLDLSLQSKEITGLYLAGQINGTTGYEEAAAQGLVAGIGAARSSRDLESIFFSRSDSYIGVLVDDLTSFGVTEPYRMFTSRAEFRLHLRQDNADRRLTQLGRILGSVDDERWKQYCVKNEAIESLKLSLEEEFLPSRKLNELGCRVGVDGPARSLFGALSLPGAPAETLIDFLGPRAADYTETVYQTVIADAQYAPYLERQQDDIRRLKRDEGLLIPEDFLFGDLSGLSSELTEKLVTARPHTIAQAARIEGMTPAALVLIAAKVSMIKHSNQNA